MEPYETKDTNLIAWLDYHGVYYRNTFTKENKQRGKTEVWFVYDQSDANFNYYYRGFIDSDYKKLLEWRQKRILPLTRDLSQ